MAALPLQLPLPQMQTTWKAILDPVIAGQDKQLVIGSPQTVPGVTTSLTYVTLTTSPSVSFTANADAIYIITGSVPVEQGTTSDVVYVRILPTAGNPQVQFSQEAVAGLSATIASISPFIYVTLLQGTVYTFVLQMKVDGGTGELRNDRPTNGTVLVAQQL